MIQYFQNCIKGLTSKAEHSLGSGNDGNNDDNDDDDGNNHNGNHRSSPSCYETEK